MIYYNSNAIYDYINEKKLQQFKFVVGNAWQLVYGDNNCNPKLLIFAVGVSYKEIDNPPQQQEIKSFQLLSILGDRSELPVKYIRFACDSDDVENVRVSDNSFIFSSMTMRQLSELFKSYGLPVSNTETTKYLNDKISSAYHKWQRNSLGFALTVSDIDLWRISNEGNPEILYELKRSYYDLDRWKPFTDDYRNFNLISNLCNKAGLEFKIVYNQRIKNPFQDKIDMLKVFSVNFSKNPPINEEGIMKLNEL